MSDLVGQKIINVMLDLVRKLFPNSAAEIRDESFPAKLQYGLWIEEEKKCDPGQK